MGTGASALIIPRVSGFDSTVLEALLECNLQLVEDRDAVQPKFSTVNKGDVAIEIGARFICIGNGNFASAVVERNDRAAYDRFLDVTGLRERIIFFLAVDSVNAYGFAVYEDGGLVRQRLYCESSEPTLIESGAPLALERPWKPTTLDDMERAAWGADDADASGFYRNAETGNVLPDLHLERALLAQLLDSQFGYPLDGEPWAERTIQLSLYRAIPEPRVTQLPAAASRYTSFWKRIFS